MIRLLLSNPRFRKGFPVRVLTDAHTSSTSEAVLTLLKERNTTIQYVLSGATQFTQFMDIRGGAAQALKNGGNNSTTAVLRKYYDKNQKSKYQRHYKANGNVLPMMIPDVIKMVEESCSSNVKHNVIKKSWDAVGSDLLPDLGTLKSLTIGLKRAFLHTQRTVKTKEEVAED